VRSAQRVVETLIAYGIQYIFGVPGAKIDPVYEVLADGGPELIVCRHEQNAAFMAAAVGRITGTPGVALVTSGPGTTNLATGLITANTEQDPMVAICGAVQRSDRLKRTHQSMDAVAALRPFTKYTGEVNDPDNVPEAVANAIRSALTQPRGAAAVVLPADVLAASTSARIVEPTPVPALGPAPAERIAEAVKLIRAAQRPVLFVGVRAGEPEPSAALRELLGVTELPVVETFQAAGVVSRELEDHFVGRVGLFRNQPGDIVIGHADVLVTIGFDPVEYDPRLWNADPGRTLIHIDEVPADIDNYYQPILELRGDIAATLSELTEALTGLQLDTAAREACRRTTCGAVRSRRRGPESSTDRLRRQSGRRGPADAGSPRRRRHGHLRCGIALYLYGPALPGVSAAAAAVLRRPADARRRAAVGDGCRTGATGHSGRVGFR
jgi:acetolactate synthase I/II/III large subunit